MDSLRNPDTDVARHSGQTNGRDVCRMLTAARRLGGRILLGWTVLAWGAAGAAPANIIVTQISKSGDTAEVEIRFACPNRFLNHSPMTAAASSKITLMRLDRCARDSISEATRPPGREMAVLDEIVYSARNGTEAILRLQFDRAVLVTVDQTGDLRRLRLHVKVPPGSKPEVNTAPSQPAAVTQPVFPAASTARVARAQVRANALASAANQAKPVTDAMMSLFVVNLRSSTDRIDPDNEDADLAQGGQILYVADTTFNNQVWHRLRLGFFATENEAHSAWLVLRSRYPDAWVSKTSAAKRAVAERTTTSAVAVSTDTKPAPVATATAAGQGPARLKDNEATELLKQARRAIIDQDYAVAIELMTRILKEPPRAETAASRELLGIIYERKGDVAQAIAEYRRYLDDYPDGSDTARVRQRLAGITTAREQPQRLDRDDRAASSRTSSWDATGSFSQYALYNASDLGGQEGWFSHSSLLTDGDFLARYRGERFNFSTRTTAAYRYNIDEPAWSAGSQSRFYNLYVDLQDLEWSLSGRLGRQRMRSEGVQGLLDGLHLSWQMQPDIRLNVTAGYPVYSSYEKFNTDRKLYGASVDFTNLPGGIIATAFLNTQTIDGLENRQAVGGQARYFDDRNSLIGAIDYDIGFSKVTSFNLLGNRSFDSGLTISASADYRREPFLTTENALIGQTAGSIDELLQSLTKGQIRNLALDRSDKMLTYSIGFSRPLAERWEINGDFMFAQTARGSTSGGVLALPDSGDEYYVYASLVGSSLFSGGDVSTFGMRFGDTYAARIYSFYLDTRYPVTHGLRLNPRLEISQREINVDGSTEWLLIPSLRLIYRFAGHYEIELEGGGETGRRTGGVVNTDTITYYLYLGYRADF